MSIAPAHAALPELDMLRSAYQARRTYYLVLTCIWAGIAALHLASSFLGRQGVDGAMIVLALPWLAAAAYTYSRFHPIRVVDDAPILLAVRQRAAEIRWVDEHEKRFLRARSGARISIREVVVELSDGTRHVLVMPHQHPRAAEQAVAALLAKAPNAQHGTKAEGIKEEQSRATREVFERIIATGTPAEAANARATLEFMDKE